MSYQLSKDDMRKILQEEGINLPEKSSRSWLDSAADKAEYFNKAFEASGLPHLGAGALATPLHLGQNLINAPGAASNALFGTDIPKVELPAEYDPSEIVKEGKPNTSQTRAMGMAGEVLGSLPAGTGAYNAALKGLGVGAKAPLLTRGAVGAGTGASLSDSDQMGGRGVGAALGGIAPLISGITAGGIGKKAGEISKKASEKYNALYEKIVKEAEKSGASKNMKAPQDLLNKTEDIEKLFKHSPAKYNASIKRFSNNPTFENAHKAQSDLGYIIRDIDKSIKAGQSLPSGIKDALPIAEKLQKRIRGAMTQSLTKSGRNDLIKEYQGATKGYLEEAVPYKTPEISQYKYNKGSAREAGKSILQGKDFAKTNAAKELPGYQTAKAIYDIPPWLKWAGGAGALYAAKEAGVPIPYLLQQLLEKSR